MQIAGSAGVSAAWLLQRLFSSGAADADPSQDTSAAGQSLPSGNGKTCKAGGASQPQLAGGTLSAMVNIQTQAPPSASDVASKLIDVLDINGDGVVSAEELQKGLTGAGISTDAASVIAKIDSNGDGNVSKDELTSAMQAKMDAEKASYGGPPAAGDVAATLIAGTDANNDGQLNLDEIANALGKTSEADKASLQQAFSAIDKNGDGKLSKDELTSAVQTDMNAHMAHHGGHGHHVEKVAASLISATDTNSDGQLSFDEVAQALNKTSDADKASLQKAFSAIDTDGNGQLSKDELASVIKETMANAARAYAQSAAITSETAQAA